MPDTIMMEYFDAEFSTEHMKQNNPYANLVMVNGFIVDIGNLPPEKLVEDILAKERRIEEIMHEIKSELEKKP